MLIDFIRACCDCCYAMERWWILDSEKARSELALASKYNYLLSLSLGNVLIKLI